MESSLVLWVLERVASTIDLEEFRARYLSTNGTAIASLSTLDFEAKNEFTYLNIVSNGKSDFAIAECVYMI